MSVYQVYGSKKQFMANICRAANFKTDDMILNLMTTLKFYVSKIIHTYSVTKLLQKIINQCFFGLGSVHI